MWNSNINILKLYILFWRVAYCRNNKLKSEGPQSPVFCGGGQTRQAWCRTELCVLCGVKNIIHALDLWLRKTAQVAKWASEPGHSRSAQSTETVSATNQLALCSLCASLAREAASFGGSSGGLWQFENELAKTAACCLALLLWKRQVTANLMMCFCFTNSAGAALSGRPRGLTRLSSVKPSVDLTDNHGVVGIIFFLPLGN